MPDSPSPDTKGAQPEQLVERLRTYADQVPTVLSVHNLRQDLRDAATALSECRERERDLEAAMQRAIVASLDDRPASAEQILAAALDAQPPSEASQEAK